MRNQRALETLRATIAATLGITLSACGGDKASEPRAVAGPGASNAVTTPIAPDASTAPPPPSNSPPPACSDWQPVLVTGVDTGYDRCMGTGALRRRAVVDCPVNPAEPKCASGPCSVNADCDAGPLGACISGYYQGCSCTYGCVKDSDCSQGEICVCGDPVGTCYAATCNAGTCGAGADCVSYGVQIAGCQNGFACTSPSDQCLNNSDCAQAVASAPTCAMSAQGRVCISDTCGIFGRPFVVNGDALLASVVLRDDWRAERNEDASALSAADRAHLARHWTEIARLEHASIASFARVVLQLLALGAPHDLVAAAQQAMLDETTHARLAFGLASAYDGQALGPGTLATDGALDGADVASVVASTFAEGCIAETVAALECAEAASCARSPAVRAVLETLARDEARHAELAWRTVAWAVSTFGATAREALRAELIRLGTMGNEALPADDERGDDWLAHGVLGERRRADLRHTAIRELALPLAAALLDAPPDGERTTCVPA